MMNIQSQIVDKLKESKHIVITAHVSPDGDSIGSSLALYLFCKHLHLNVSICHPDPAPKFLSWMEGFDELLNLEKNTLVVNEKIATADLIICLDYNHPSRVGEKMQGLIERSSAFKIMIDHHLHPSDFANIIFSDTSACSTCQLIFELLDKSKHLAYLTEAIGTAIYVGIMTDTGSFRFNSVKPYTHEILAHLLKIGVQNDLIHERVFDINTEDKLKLRAYAVSENLKILREYQLAYLFLSKEELKRFHYQTGDTEGLVNVALSIEGIKMAAFFSEDEDKIKISFRSKGTKNPVNTLASRYFNGGGHANAAGGKYEGKLEDAIKLFLKVLPEFQ